MNQTIQTFASLRCRIFDQLEEGESPERAVVLCHGFGAPGDDLATFGPDLLAASPRLAKRCRLYFPEAPIDLGPMGLPGGRAWWPINMQALGEMHQTRDFSQLTEVEPPGMAEATAQYAEAVAAIQKADGIQESQLVLGGFSQGAMINTNLVLQNQLTPDLLVLFSGCLLAGERWRQQAASHSGCSVLQSHGNQDTVLPFSAAEALRDLLVENGFDVSFEAFSGPHTIPMGILQQLVERLSSD